MEVSIAPHPWVHTSRSEAHARAIKTPHRERPPRSSASNSMRPPRRGRTSARREKSPRERAIDRPRVMGSSEKTPKKDKREKTPKKDDDDDSDGPGGGAMRPTAAIARPLADAKTTKKILKTVKRGACARMMESCACTG